MDSAPANAVAPDAMEALAAMQGELDRLRAECDHLGRLASLGTLAATVAHEFNNIAAGVANSARFAELALGPADAEAPGAADLARARRAVARCSRTAAKSSRLCNAILGFAGNDTADPQHGVTASDVALVIEQALDAMVRRPEQDGIALTVDVSPGLRAAIDPLALEQILLNLLLNARRALLAKPAARRRLRVEGLVRRDRVELRVIDTGCGIAAADLQRIFDGFFTTGNDRRGDAGGTGLGLTLSRQLVERHGGTISVESDAGHGSTFTLTLPRAD